MGAEVSKYQNLCQQLLAENEQLKKVSMCYQKTNVEVERVGQKVFKEAVSQFTKELANNRVRILSSDLPEQLLNK